MERHRRDHNSQDESSGEEDLASDGSQLSRLNMISTSTSSCSVKKEANMVEKNEMFGSMLEMMRMSSLDEIASKLLMMSKCPPLCHQMREYGYLSMIIEYLHQPSDCDQEVSVDKFRQTAKSNRKLIEALGNLVCHTSVNIKEVKVLKMLEDLRGFVATLYNKANDINADSIDHPCTLMKDIYAISSDNECLKYIELLGGIYAIAEAFQVDYFFHKSNSNDSCFQIRRFSLMILTDLTCNNLHIKSQLGSMKSFMTALVANLQSPTTDELVQSVANLLRNLSCQTNYISKQTMQDVEAVPMLTKIALTMNKESTLRAILTALWNLTANCTPNKADFCKVRGALQFIISKLSVTATSAHSLQVIEFGGGILRNISSYIATKEEYCEVLRQNKVIHILLDHLELSSLNIVSNACIILSNLSATCLKDQMLMLELGAIKKLSNLKNSKHSGIREGASSTLKNLLTSQAYIQYSTYNISAPGSMTNSFTISSFPMRKIKGIRNEYSSCINENYGLVGDSSCPRYLYTGTNDRKSVSRSDSHDSIGSTHSEPLHSKFRTERPMTGLTTSQDSGQVANQSYHGAMCNSMYATLPANSRFADKAGIDYDVYLTDVNGQMSMSSSSTKTSFIDNDLEVDPEPTDYSKRYQEQQDDFTAPRSANKANEAVGCEDSVRVYQTENTPLVYSLAPSFTDLREIHIKDSFEDRGIKHNVMHTSHHHQTQMQAHAHSVSHSYSANDLKSTKETVTFKPMPAYRKPFVMAKPSPKMHTIQDNEFAQNDQPITYATEDTPAIFSHATSLSSITDEINNDEKILPQINGNKSHMIQNSMITENAGISCNKSTGISTIQEANNEPDVNENSINTSDLKDDSSDDDEILQKWIEHSMPVQKPRRVQHKSPRFHKRYNPNQLRSKPSDLSMAADQKKQFFVEDTPVHFSTVHSSLSSLSFGSDDEINDNKLVTAAINLGMNRNGKEGGAVAYPTNGSHYPSETSGAMTSVEVPNSSGTTAPTQQSTTIAPVPQSSASTVAKQPSQSMTSASSQSTPRNYKSAAVNYAPMEDAEEDDPKTYTVCTQPNPQAHGHYQSTNQANLVVSRQIVTNSAKPLSPKVSRTRPVPPTRKSDSDANKNSRASDTDENNYPSLDDALLNQPSLLENVKPPSIIDHSSLMSQSSTSIDSQISDIAFDQVPVRTSNEHLVAEAASNCAKEINDMVQSCLKVDNSTSDKSNNQNMSGTRTKSSEDLLSNQRTFEVEHASLTLPRPKDRLPGSVDTQTYNKDDRFNVAQGYNCYDSDQSDTDISEALPLDDVRLSDFEDTVNDTTSSATRSTVLYNKPNIDQTTSSDLSPSRSQSSKTYKVYPSNTSPTKAAYTEKTDAELLESAIKQLKLTTKNATLSRKDELMMDDEQMFCPFGSSPHYTVSTRSLNRGHKFLNSKADFEDKDMMLTPKHKNMVMANQALFFQKKSGKGNSKYYERHVDGQDEDEDHLPIQFNTHKLLDGAKSNNNLSSPVKNKEKSSLLSNVKSRLSASFSSHNIGGMSSSVSSSSKDSSKKIEVKSKIASFWSNVKRSKSTHDKLDNELLDSNHNRNSKAEELNRLISSRRSFGKGSSLDDQSPGLYHYGSLTKKRDKSNCSSNFTFVTFSKSPKSKNNGTESGSDTQTSPFEAVVSKSSMSLGSSCQSMDGDITNGTVSKSISSGIEGDGKNEGVMSTSSRPTPAARKSLAKQMNSVSSTSSAEETSSQSRKTCLVTTV